MSGLRQLVIAARGCPRGSPMALAKAPCPLC